MLDIPENKNASFTCYSYSELAQKVLDFLKKNKNKKYTAKTLKEISEVSCSSITKVIRNLLSKKEIKIVGYLKTGSTGTYSYEYQYILGKDKKIEFQNIPDGYSNVWKYISRIKPSVNRTSFRRWIEKEEYQKYKKLFICSEKRNLCECYPLEVLEDAVKKYKNIDIEENTCDDEFEY